MRVHLALTFVLLRGTASAAHAATTSPYTSSSKTVTLNNDSTAESFSVVPDTSVSPGTYQVTGTNAVIPSPSPSATNASGQVSTSTRTVRLKG